MNNSVPECAYVNRKAEQVLILENQFCPIGKKCFVKSPTPSTFPHIIFSKRSCVHNKHHFYSLFELHDVTCLWIQLFKRQHRDIHRPSECNSRAGYHLYLQTNHPV
jgi:hypothetical protein